MELTLMAAGFLEWLSGAGNIFKVVIGLGFVIFVHELGHFLLAKACGVKCEKFYVGFDVQIKLGPLKVPKTLGKFQWGETEYGIGIIPLGGYVKMLGQDDNPSAQSEELERIKTTDEEGREQIDPRSYQAKPVWQRMLIISAGVIFNIIFAVIMAMAAYKMGVPYRTTDMAGTSAGDPAWVADFPIGGKLIQVGKKGEPDENMRFLWDLTQNVAKSGLDEDAPVKPLDLLIRNGESRNWHTIVGTRRKGKFPTIGVRPARTTILGSTPTVEFSVAAKADPGFEKGDVIVAVNGNKLPVDELTGKSFFHDIEQYLAEHISKPLTFTVKRIKNKDSDNPEETTLDIVVAPSPMTRLGLVMEIGPIVGIRKGTPAADADFKKGDILKSIDGQPVGDPLTLSQRFAATKTNKEVTFIVERKLGEDDAKTKEVEIKVTPRGPNRYVARFGSGDRIALETVGIACEVSAQVIATLPDSPASQAGFQAGDKITAYQIIATDEARKRLKKKYGRRGSRELLKKEEVDDVNNWLAIYHAVDRLESLGEGLSVQLTYQRGEETKTVDMTPATMPGMFELNRGLRTTPFERVHVAESWGDALRLGVRETKERMGEVFSILRMLLSGQVGAKNLAGPLGILTVASAEASHGIPRLLIFLTLLSANLAILNFLPIPVLDGGHFAFLLWELVRGKPASERVQINAQMIGLIALLSLIVYVSWNDIMRIFGAG